MQRADVHRPVHPALGKMIALGVIFRCLDTMIILGAAGTERSMIYNPLGRRGESLDTRRLFSAESGSHHIAFLNAFCLMRDITAKEEYKMARDTLKDSLSTMMPSNASKQLPTSSKSSSGKLALFPTQHQLRGIIVELAVPRSTRPLRTSLLSKPFSQPAYPQILLSPWDPAVSRLPSATFRR